MSSDRYETGSAMALINKMVELRIFEEPDDCENINVDELKFTREFDNSLVETVRRLASDPNNIELNLNEGLRSMLVNYIGDKVDEDELQRISKNKAWIHILIVGIACRIQNRIDAIIGPNPM
jgi:hypothetical protein